MWVCIVDSLSSDSIHSQNVDGIEAVLGTGNVDLKTYQRTDPWTCSRYCRKKSLSCAGQGLICISTSTYYPLEGKISGTTLPQPRTRSATRLPAWCNSDRSLVSRESLKLCSITACACHCALRVTATHRKANKFGFCPSGRNGGFDWSQLPSARYQGRHRRF